MTIPISTILTDILKAVVVTLVASSVISMAGYFLSARFQSTVNRILNYIFDTKVTAQLSRVDRYDTKPAKKLNKEIFNEIREISDSVTFDALSNENVLRIENEDLPTPIEIKIQKEHTFAKDDPIPDRYEVIIKTYTELTFGYRSNQALYRYETLSRQISKVIKQECFTDKPPGDSFLLVTIRGKLPAGKEEIEDTNLSIHAESRGESVKMTFENPDHLHRGLQKYLRPI